MCTQIGFSSCDGILKYKLKVGSVIGCAKTLNEAVAHVNSKTKINKMCVTDVIRVSYL